MITPFRFSLLIRAALLAFAAVSTAQAQIVYTDPADLFKSGGASLYVDMGTAGGQGSFGSVNSGGLFDFRVNSNSPGIVALTNTATNGVVGAAWVDNIALDTTIDGNLSYTSSSRSFNNFAQNNNANWPAGTTGYVALRFDGDDTAGVSVLYGWLQVTMNSTSSITVHDFAYEASGGSILAGQTATAVPEPSTYAMMAGLLAGAAALYRRRRKSLLPQ